MSSVTFPTAIGGDGSTVSDDDNATTGLRNGGWRTRFIPCFTNLVNIADYFVSYTAQTSTFASPPPMGFTAPNTGKFTTLTTTDNFGLKTTSSAWYSTTGALDISSFGAVAQNSSGALTTTFNAYQSSAGASGWVYKTTNPAAKYECGANGTGVHSWFNASSGTAGNAISFTQAMTLDASGQLMVGATAAAGIIYGLGTSSNGYATISDGTGYIVIGGSSAVTGGGITGGNGAIRTSGDLNICTGGAIERMRVDASGNLQIFGLVMPGQGTPTTKSAGATLTGGELITGLLTVTGVGGITVNFPTAATIETALTWGSTNTCIDFYVVNTSSGTVTMGVNGNTQVGTLSVGAGLSAQFRIRRTASSTFTIYRLG